MQQSVAAREAQRGEHAAPNAPAHRTPRGQRAIDPLSAYGSAAAHGVHASWLLLGGAAAILSCTAMHLGRHTLDLTTTTGAALRPVTTSCECSPRAHREHGVVHTQAAVTRTPEWATRASCTVEYALASVQDIQDERHRVASCWAHHTVPYESRQPENSARRAPYDHHPAMRYIRGPPGGLTQRSFAFRMREPCV